MSIGLHTCAFRMASRRASGLRCFQPSCPFPGRMAWADRRMHATSATVCRRTSRSTRSVEQETVHTVRWHSRCVWSGRPQEDEMRIHCWIVVATVIAGAALPSNVFAQSAAPPGDTISTPSPAPQNTPDPQQPAAVGEEATKPTRGFFSSLLHNLGDDFRHMPRRNSLYWLAGGGALALAVHPADQHINAHLLGEDRLWTTGKYLGSTQVLLPAAFATYLIA